MSLRSDCICRSILLLADEKLCVNSQKHQAKVQSWLQSLQAGLLVAETEFALQVESDIAPYKGLLMGLFFMTVGMEISAGLFFAEWKTVVSGIVLLIGGKVMHLTSWSSPPLLFCSWCWLFTCVGCHCVLLVQLIAPTMRMFCVLPVAADCSTSQSI